jgi:UDP-N-acetylmuramyl-tripeptide synthetase
MKTLGDLLRDVDVLALEPSDAGALEIRGVHDDSRQVGSGDLFVALPGQTVDGHRYLEMAAQRGAVAAIVERDDVSFPGVRVRVRSAARSLGRVAAAWHGRPAEAMTLIGITGTNGKTTCTYLVEALLVAHGARSGVIGTVVYRSPAGQRPAPFTTPTSLLLHATLAEMRDASATHVVMECSSHALALDRLEGVDFTVAAFTNLTQDHLDFHSSIEDYGAQKRRLFTERLRPAGIAVICVDGVYGEGMAAAARGRVLRVSSDGGSADVRVRRADLRSDGTRLELATPIGPLTIDSPLVGGFNVENLVVAVGVGIALGVSGETIVRALATAPGAPGRLERVERPGIDVVGYVDYAHTPDALERALRALRPTTRGALWVVFGCGGDRDRGKRPQMGRIAAAGADRVIVTSDNPRTEPPDTIIEQILAGVPAHRSARDPAHGSNRGAVEVIEDRRAAIAHAVDHAAAGDVILVAGKGHEDYQIIGAERRRFDDREVVAEALQRRGEKVAP